MVNTQAEPGCSHTSMQILSWTHDVHLKYTINVKKIIFMVFFFDSETFKYRIPWIRRNPHHNIVSTKGVSSRNTICGELVPKTTSKLTFTAT